MRLRRRFRPIYTLLYNKYYFDELYDLILIRPILAISRFMWSFDANVVDGAVNGTAWLTVLWADIKMWFDKWIIDGAVNGSGWLVRTFGSFLKYMQSGAVQFYALFLLGGIIVVMLAKIEGVLFKSVGWPMLTTFFVAGLVALGIASKVIFTREARLEPQKKSKNLRSVYRGR